MCPSLAYRDEQRSRFKVSDPDNTNVALSIIKYECYDSGGKKLGEQLEDVWQLTVDRHVAASGRRARRFSVCTCPDSCYDSQHAHSYISDRWRRASQLDFLLVL